MAQNDKPEADDAAPSGGGRKTLIMMIGAVVVALAAGAGITWFLVKPDASDLAAAANPCHAANGNGGGDPAVTFAERVLALEPFVVNVSGHDYARYLKVKIELEADSPEVRDELETRLPQVRDGVIVLLSSKRLADITDFEGKALLKEDIRERINGILSKGNVESVLFTEFVVQ